MRNRLYLVAMLMFGAMLLWAAAASSYSPGEEGAVCLGCHSNKEMALTFKNGEKLSVFVDEKELAESVHKGMACSKCHAGFSAEQHPGRQFASRRQFAAAAAEGCKRCHAFARGMHAKMLGNLRGAVCVDCHSAHSVKPARDNGEGCAACHRYPVAVSFKDGSTHRFQVDEAGLRSSVHKKLRCTDCHFGFSSREHPQRTFKDRRNFTIVAAETCRRCHFDKYTKTLEGIHFNLLLSGNLKAPVCVDCHGAHTINSGRHEKVLSAQRCENCHQEIYRTYSMSVHGKALISSHNQDVPVCSDCHRAHDLFDPHLADFRNNIPQMCSNCHANEDLMKRYGLSTAVLKSYLEDFHGVTITFYKKQKNSVRHIAVCTDCHGIHDITKTKGPDASVVKANLVKRCRKCHPDAADNFPESWISHYEPDFKRAPLVYAVNFVYKIFIPFMIVGLVLQIILHIWRYAVNR